MIQTGVLGRTICLLITCPQIFMQQDGDTLIMWCLVPFHFTIIFVEILLLAQHVIYFNLPLKILLSLNHVLNMLFSFLPHSSSCFLMQNLFPVLLQTTTQAANRSHHGDESLSSLKNKTLIAYIENGVFQCKSKSLSIISRTFFSILN